MMGRAYQGALKCLYGQLLLIAALIIFTYQLMKSNQVLNVNAYEHGYAHDGNARVHSRKRFCILHFL